jgi:type III pantothenate kinase
MILKNVIAIDIGNTNTHVGMVDLSKLTCRKRSDFPSTSIKSRLTGIIKALRVAHSCPIVICSVYPAAGKLAYHLIQDQTPDQPVKFHYHPQCPITLAYKNPSSLGADRLANLLYAHYALPGENVIIIDAGTAVTVDILEKGKHYTGGVIFPGPSTQFSSLHRNTGALPLVKSGAAPLKFPGISTESCIEAGVYYGVAGAVSRCVAELTRTHTKPVILATGGAWKSIKNLADFKAAYLPDLTLIGTACHVRTLR